MTTSSLPPAPTFEPFTTLDKKVIDRTGNAPVRVTSLMWMEWFQRLSGYLNTGVSDHDSILLSSMEKGHQGDVNDIKGEERNNAVAAMMGGASGISSSIVTNTDELIIMQSTDLNEVMKIRHDMEVLIAMGGL
jgi:hypothetical protein